MGDPVGLENASLYPVKGLQTAPCLVKPGSQHPDQRRLPGGTLGSFVVQQLEHLYEREEPCTRPSSRVWHADTHLLDSCPWSQTSLSVHPSFPRKTF